MTSIITHHLRLPSLTSAPWALLAVLALLLAAGDGEARPVEGLYGVTVPLAEDERQPGSQTARRALEQVLVRITGQRDIALAEEAQPLLQQADRLVQQQGLASRREVRYVFDGASVRREVIAAGLPFWERERPQTLLLLLDEPRVPLAGEADGRERAAADPLVGESVQGPREASTGSVSTTAPADASMPTSTVGVRAESPWPGGETADGMMGEPAARAPISLPPVLDDRLYLAADEQSEELERALSAADRRGLPLVLPVMDEDDQALLYRRDAPAGIDLPASSDLSAGSDAPVERVDPVSKLMGRYDADVVLLGQVSRAVDGLVLVDWTLLAPKESEDIRWVGAPEDGVEFLADLLAQRYATRVVDSQRPVALRVDEVTGVLAYAQTLAHLQRLELVERVAVERVRGSSLFITLLSGAEPVKLERLIGLADFLRPVEQRLEGDVSAELHFQYFIATTADRLPDEQGDDAPGGDIGGPAGATPVRPVGRSLRNDPG